MSAADLVEGRRLPDPAPGIKAWTCDIARDPGDARALATLLAPAEMLRMDRFGRDDLRLRYAVGRATLRTLLAEELGMKVRDVEIVRGLRGRPQLSDTHRSDIDFNVSHTRSKALFSITRARRIGVDIEHGERTLNVEGVSRKFMTGPEQARLATLHPDARRRELLLLWTCKEAMSKATGDALAAPFRRMDVDTAQGRVLVAGPAPYDPADWSLHAIDVGGGYLATAAAWTPRSR